MLTLLLLNSSAEGNAKVFGAKPLFKTSALEEVVNEEGANNDAATVDDSGEIGDDSDEASSDLFLESVSFFALARSYIYIHKYINMYIDIYD